MVSSNDSNDNMDQSEERQSVEQHYIEEAIAQRDAENKIRLALAKELGVNWTFDSEGYIVSSDQQFSDQISEILDAKHESLRQYWDWRP